MDRDLDAIAAAYRDGSDPIPTSEESFVGDGDYRAIGAEFLGHFVRLGGLTPDERVLEIGCGIGRMAMPLGGFLSERGRYHGMDVVEAGIDWCRSNIAARDSRFTFSCLNLYHPLYNPEGRESATVASFPAEDASVDLLVATSVFTHLSRQVFERYIDESARVLSPGGRVFATVFVISPEVREVTRDGKSRYPFDLSEPGPLYRPAKDSLLSAVAVDEEWLLDRMAAAGLELGVPIEHGFWPYEDPAHGLSYQDICVFRRSGG